MLTEARIIEIRQQTRAVAMTPWADTIAFAKSIEQEVLAALQNDQQLDNGEKNGLLY